MAITTRSAVTFSIIGRYLTLSLQFVSTMVLARLLTPEDIGIYSAGFSIVALAHLFRDFGLNQYVIQEKSLDEMKIRTTFTLSLIIAWTLGALLFLSSGFVAEFFKEPGVEELIHILAFNFFIIPFGSITLALLRKNLKFHVTESISFIATLLGIIVAIWTAYTGSRYLCLAYGAITETTFTVVFSYFFRPKGVKLSPSLEGAKRIFRFGSLVGIGNITTQFSTSATDALVARILGISSLGFFSRAFGTFSLFDNIFVSSIRPTILPLFSRDNHDLDKLAANYMKAIAYSFIFAWPFFAFLFLYTTEVIRSLYGHQWDIAIPLVKILCGAGVVMPMILFTENLFIAYGRPDISLRIQLTSNIVKITMVAIGCSISLEAVCIALAASFWVKCIIAIIFTRKVLGIRLTQLLALARQALIPLACTILPTVVVKLFMHDTENNSIIIFATLMACAFIGWLVGIKITNHAFYIELKPFFSRQLSQETENR